jgi:hypothetical protein
MKLRIVLDVDVSPTIAKTIQRTGFNLCPDGSSMQVQVPNSPAIPRRKTRIEYVENPQDTISEMIAKARSQFSTNDVVLT